MLEPSDSQEAYDFFMFQAFEISERWGLPVLLRATTRVCHSKTLVHPPRAPSGPAQPPTFKRDVRARVMITANARRPPPAATEAGRDSGVERNVVSDPIVAGDKWLGSLPQAFRSCTHGKRRREPRCSN